VGNVRRTHNEWRIRNNPIECSTCHRRAISLTAMPPRIFSRRGRSSGKTSFSSFDPVADA